MRRFVFVTGLPASGKSTVAQALSALLDLPLIDKDVLLERLFEEHGIGDASWRQQLSRIADQSLIEATGRSQGAVVASWWRHPRSVSETGTPVAWISTLRGSAHEVHCEVRPQVAIERFMRRQRHPGHLDALRSRPELLKQFENQAMFGPLLIGQLITVSGEQPLAAQLPRLLALLDA